MNSLYAGLFRSIQDLNFQMEILEEFNWDESEQDKFNKNFLELLSNTNTAEDLHHKLSQQYSRKIVTLVFDFIRNHEKDLNNNNGGDIEA